MITHSVYTLARILQSYEKTETSTCYIPATWSRKNLSNEGLNPPYNTLFPRLYIRSGIVYGRSEIHRGSSTRIAAPSADVATRSAALYDMNGRQLNEKPNKGVYIQSGQKFISK